MGAAAVAEAPKPANELRGGIECRWCGCRWLRVYRTSRMAGKVVRCRVCQHCGKKTWTTEAAK